ncbi:SH3 domain-containing protein [Halalkalibaculum sp. DA3122]|uniref:SH3 domain-containing protein n=1 Tax=Halalkalibaculum sp. DA3122 TaxID=3373607 RepID=UPI003754AE6C
MNEDKENKRIQFYLSEQYQKSMEQLSNAIKTNALAGLSQQFSEINKIAINPSLKLAEALSSANFLHDFDFAKIAKLNEEVFSQFNEQQQKIYQELNLNIANNIAALANNINTAELAIASVANLPRVDFKKINEVYKQELALEEFDRSSRETLLEDINHFFRKKIEELPKGKISAHGLLHLYMAVLTTISLVLTYSQSQVNNQVSDNLSTLNENQVKSNEILTDLNQEVIPLLNDLAKDDSEELIYIVTKESPIREQATSNADTLYRVYPNQPVKILKDQKRWFYVEYFDYEKSIPKMGYIYKGNVEKYNSK